MYKTVDKTIYKQAFSPETLIRCWNECQDTSSFPSRRIQVEEFNKKNYWKKRGIAMIPMKFSVGFAASSYHQVSLVHVVSDPRVRHTLGPNVTWDERHISQGPKPLSPAPGRRVQNYPEQPPFCRHFQHSAGENALLCLLQGQKTTLANMRPAAAKLPRWSVDPPLTLAVQKGDRSPQGPWHHAFCARWSHSLGRNGLLHTPKSEAEMSFHFASTSRLFS